MTTKCTTTTTKSSTTAYEKKIEVPLENKLIFEPAVTEKSVENLEIIKTDKPQVNEVTEQKIDQDRLKMIEDSYDGIEYAQNVPQEPKNVPEIEETQDIPGKTLINKNNL